MNAEQKELFRLVLLRVLDTNRTRFGLGVVALGHHLAPFAFNPGNCGGQETFHAAIADALDYFTTKQMVEEAGKQISAENRAWRITATGIAFLDERS